MKMRTIKPLRFAITSGEPAGVGPDLCLELMLRLQRAKAQFQETRYVVFGSKRLFSQRAKHLGITDWQPNCYLKDQQQDKPYLFFDLDDCLGEEVCHWQDTPGKPTSLTAPLVYKQLDLAIDGCLSGEFGALITAPVQKSVLTHNDQCFTGHTEYLQQRSQSPHVTMLLASLGITRFDSVFSEQLLANKIAPLVLCANISSGMKVALATTHIPIRSVADSLSKHCLIDTLRILNNGLKTLFQIKKPQIMVLGLNPHAGESGHLGREEVEIIEPVIQLLQQEGLQCFGPIPADTAFTPKRLSTCDAVLAMYHDQGLPVLKHQGFGRSANITLGLPFIRTSVDHGTALDIAGSGQADIDGLLCALAFAQGCVQLTSLS